MHSADCGVSARIWCLGGLERDLQPFYLYIGLSL